MCEASVYLKQQDGETLVMEAVDQVEPEKEGVRLTNIFGEQKYVEARIHSMSLVDHKVFLTAAG